MLLTTGNKSEVAVGYATIYGDMAGGYNPIKDLYKTRVFRDLPLAQRQSPPLDDGPGGRSDPAPVIDKPPTAELRDDQNDDDSLPPYEVLDVILEQLIDHEASVAEVVAMGYDRATVKKVEHLIYISEYKRFQSAPGAAADDRAASGWTGAIRSSTAGAIRARSDLIETRCARRTLYLASFRRSGLARGSRRKRFLNPKMRPRIHSDADAHLRSGFGHAGRTAVSPRSSRRRGGGDAGPQAILRVRRRARSIA